MADEESEQATRGEGGFDAWIAELREAEPDNAPALDVSDRITRMEHLLERSLNANAALADRLSALGEEVRAGRISASAPRSEGGGGGQAVGATDVGRLLAALTHTADNLDTGLATMRSALSTSQKGVAARLDDLWLAVTRGYEELQQRLEERLDDLLSLATAPAPEETSAGPAPNVFELSAPAGLLPGPAPTEEADIVGGESHAGEPMPAGAGAEGIHDDDLDDRWEAYLADTDTDTETETDADWEPADPAAATITETPGDTLAGEAANDTRRLSSTTVDDLADAVAERLRLASGELPRALLDEMRVELEVRTQDMRDSFSVLARHLTTLEARLGGLDDLTRAVADLPATMTAARADDANDEGEEGDAPAAGDAVVDFLATLDERLQPISTLREMAHEVESLGNRFDDLDRLREAMAELAERFDADALARIDMALSPAGPYASLLEHGGGDDLETLVMELGADLTDLASRVATSEALTDLAGRVATNEALNDLAARVATTETLAELAGRVATQDALAELTLRVATGEALAELADRLATRRAVEQLAAKVASGEALAQLTSRVATSEAVAELATQLATSDAGHAAAAGTASDAQWQDVSERLAVLDDIVAGLANLATVDTVERLADRLANAETVGHLAERVATADAVAAQSSELAELGASLRVLAQEVREGRDRDADRVLAELDQSVTRMVEEVRSLASTAIAQDEADKAADERLADLAGELERSAREATQRLSAQVGALRDWFEASTRGDDGRGERLETALTHIEGQAEQFQAVRDSVERLAATVDALQARTSDLTAAADTGRLMTRLGDVARELSGSTDRIADLDRRLAGLRADLAEVAGMARDSSQAAGAAGRAVSTVASLERRLDAELDTVARRLEALASAIEALLRAQRDDITGRGGAVADRLSALRTVAAGISDAVRTDLRKPFRAGGHLDTDEPRIPDPHEGN